MQKISQKKKLLYLCESIVSFPHNDYKNQINKYFKFISKHSTPNEKNAHLHHIIPKCLGGTNDKFNLVKLSEKDHLKAHEILSYIFHGHQSLKSAVLILNGTYTKEIDDSFYNDYPLSNLEELYDSSILFEVLEEEGYIYDHEQKIYIKYK